MKCVETLTDQEDFDNWNITGNNGIAPILMALEGGNTEIVRLLLRCPRVNLDIIFSDGKYFEDIVR